MNQSQSRLKTNSNQPVGTRTKAISSSCNLLPKASYVIIIPRSNYHMVTIIKKRELSFGKQKQSENGKKEPTVKITKDDIKIQSNFKKLIKSQNKQKLDIMLFITTIFTIVNTVSSILQTIKLYYK
jgi:hypothetical protein